MGACRHCGRAFGPDHHPTAVAAGNYYCGEVYRTAHLVGVYSPSIDRRVRRERRLGDRRMGERRAS